MIERIKLSRQELLALRRLRNGNDGQLIKGILTRILDVDREDYEESEANEQLRLQLLADKRTIAVLFDAELEQEETL